MEIDLEKVLVRIRWAVIRLQGTTTVGMLLRLWCRIGARLAGRTLALDPRVTSVYSRHTHPDYPSFVPGHSDLDITVIVSKKADRIPGQIETLARKVEAMRAVHYYINPNDVRFVSLEELNQTARDYSSPTELLYTPRDWVLLGGREVHLEKPAPFPDRLLPWHPEFNRFWGHILQEYLLARQPGREEHYLRVYYRSAIKQQLLFQAARGNSLTKPHGHVDDDMLEAAFSGKPEVLGLLTEIKRGGFWRRDARRVKKRILFDVFQSAINFFDDHPLQTRDCAGYPVGEGISRHLPAYARIHGLLQKTARLKAMLKGALAYPVPHSYPYVYHLDLVFPNGLASTDFGQLIELVQAAFGNREFHAGKYLFVATVVPEALAGPLPCLGSPYPFLREHIHHFGCRLTASGIQPLEGPFDRVDLEKWCRIFYPYHMATLNRRIDKSSRTTNFCQLASIRIFLASGRILTDPVDVRSRHKVLFADDTPEDFVWDYLLRDKPGRLDSRAYHAALGRYQRECRAVDRLLRN